MKLIELNHMDDAYRHVKGILGSRALTQQCSDRAILLCYASYSEAFPWTGMQHGTPCFHFEGLTPCFSSSPMISSNFLWSLAKPVHHTYKHWTFAASQQARQMQHFLDDFGWEAVLSYVHDFKNLRHEVGFLTDVAKNKLLTSD